MTTLLLLLLTLLAKGATGSDPLVAEPASKPVDGDGGPLEEVGAPPQIDAKNGSHCLQCHITSTSKREAV